MSKPKKHPFPHDKARCHKCNIKAGAVAPNDMSGVTVCFGTCEDCGRHQGIVPSSDYDWPRIGKKAMWD